METIRNIAASISVSAILIGAIHILCPEGKMGKQLRYVAGLLMILAIIAPFTASSAINLSFSASSSLSIDAKDMLEGQVVYIIEQLLGSEGITFKRIVPYMDISSEGDISIYRIYVNGASDVAAAKKILEENFPECEIEVLK